MEQSVAKRIISDWRISKEKDDSMPEGYTPKPIDTLSIELPESLEPLLERLAENTHEVWATQRIKDGWTYGTARDDEKKKHPGLVSYSDLPESEKAYDRMTAGEALKAVIAMGYQISKQQDASFDQ